MGERPAAWLQTAVTLSHWCDSGCSFGVCVVCSWLLERPEMCPNLPSLPPPPQPSHSGGSVLDTQQVPRRHFLIEWGHWFYTHLYLDLPLFLVRFFLANFCLSGWHWHSCTCSLKRIICPLMLAPERGLLTWPNSIFFYEIFSKSASCWFVNSTRYL